VKVKKAIATSIVFVSSLLCLESNSRCLAADNNQGGGLLNSLGGILQRAESQPASSNGSSINLKSIESALEQSLTNQSSSNVVSLTNRLHSFLNLNAPGATNSAGATNIIAKLTDWLKTSQQTGTNVSTNSISKRAWSALTNAIAAHAATNSVGTNAVAGNDFVGKLRDWVSNERQKTSATGTTNSTSASLALVENYLHSLTNSASSNASNLALTNAIEQARSRFFDRFRTNQAK
jgi:hypothetical protein